MEEATENGFHMDIVDSTEDGGVINPGFSEPNGNYYSRDTYIQRLCQYLVCSLTKNAKWFTLPIYIIIINTQIRKQ